MSETRDGVDHLRIPFEKIKFGKKLETEGYGTVLEGEFDGQRVALKRLNITNLANIKAKLLAEILTISRFRQHPNLVALLGFCDEKSNEIILVYEYVGSGNLADKMRKRLTTIQRFEICLGAARGLDYLHTGVDATTPGIVHGNIKLSKILLNSDAISSKFVAKVSSYGLSKIVPGKAQKSVESSDEVTEKVTKESDVYSFGVLLLEVLCGVAELVDTDDYQERHVTELVPKKMQQNKLQKVVHFDIRKEIKTEALETYAKIACQCVMQEPDARPTMAQVGEELEKALRLQGGEVTYVQIPGNTNIAGANDNTVVEVKLKDDAGEDNGDEVGKVGQISESTNGEKNVVEDTNTESEDAKNENSNNDPATTKEILNDLNSKKESVENEKENENQIPIEDAHKEMSTIDPVTTEKTIDDFNSNKNSNIIEENEDDQSMRITTSTSTSQEVQDSEILKSDRGNLNEVNHEDELESSNNDPTAKKETLNDLNFEKESKEMNAIDREITEETIDDFDSDKKLKITEENKEDNQSMKITTTSESSNGDISTSINQEVEDSGILISDRGNFNEVNHEDELESSNNDPATKKEILNDLNFKKESNITVEKEEETKNIIPIEDAHKEMSTNDPKTTQETIEDLDSDKRLKITEENKEDNQSMKITTTSESSIGDTSTSTNQELQDIGNFSEVIEDELEGLRIPLEKIKFGQKIDFRGYGTMFEGEFNHQQVALKRLNITNLRNIKPKLLSAILTISRFRQHPNLVALIGFCDENNKEIILVYEYLSGGNLADKMSKHLTTIQRLQICLGAARGLEYLHSGVEYVDSFPGIIHGNLRLSKIMLNSDSTSSTSEAKVSGFGLPKLLPGHIEIAPKSIDPVFAATGKLTKGSDVYTFGVLLLEVLCGVPELVDTDDYQERHVTELVPKRLKQDMLRKIVHFDIRDEITNESLETYAKIASRCVMKNPEERPTMSEVVVELEKALRLQGGKVSDVKIFGSSNGNGLPKVPVGEDDHEDDDNGETITEEESTVIEETIDDIPVLGQSFPVTISGSNDVETVPEVAEKENGDNMNDPKSTEETTVNLKLKEVPEVPVGEDSQEGGDNVETKSSNIIEAESKVTEETTDDIALEDVGKDNRDNINVPESKEEIESKINGENEVNKQRKITTSFSNSAMIGHGFPLPGERSEYEDATKEKDHNPHMEESKDVQNSADANDNAKTGLLNTEKPELVVNTRGDFSNSATQTQESENKRSNSTRSESSNDDDTTPLDYLLPKSPANGKKASTDYGNCCCALFCTEGNSGINWWHGLTGSQVLTKKIKDKHIVYVRDWFLFSFASIV
ncbi:hypothetical protein L1987_70072 [Smallanthus sonchifolius]|uniref:Uncharacterized protein n=1 Tax=Smallanthus sonchifolius TaxID=185202 RepID=A0ACB9AP99_9ASTR|nr:hypothetical protein L1987_70072 [Smallanthus sonchifolius]